MTQTAEVTHAVFQNIASGEQTTVALSGVAKFFQENDGSVTLKRVHGADPKRWSYAKIWFHPNTRDVHQVGAGAYGYYIVQEFVKMHEAFL